MRFSRYVGIDYSGARAPTSRLRTLQVYCASDGLPEKVFAPFRSADQRRNWSRQEIADWLTDLALSGESFIAGLDHGFGFPVSYLRRYKLSSWGHFLDDFVENWPTDEPHMYVDHVRRNHPPRTGPSNELRLCEKWTSSAKSVFRFDVQGQVAKSTHAGIPWLRRMRVAAGDRLHFWPFDGWGVPEGKSVIAEMYPSILRNRYPREKRSTDEQDAYSIARWLKETCQRGFMGRYLDPPLTDEERKIASLEGWILGIA
ncbi:MAG: hypothetical protein HPY44_09445 [Armatimonadetes bacterium]|nr:hypothetical protein [Armatimonadota bacterium]